MSGPKLKKAGHIPAPSSRLGRRFPSIHLAHVMALSLPRKVASYSNGALSRPLLCGDSSSGWLVFRKDALLVHVHLIVLSKY